MRKSLCCLLMSLLVGGVALFAQDQNSGVDYTTALQKKGQERINAFESYVKKYPSSPENPFTVYAYYWLARDYYNLKKYGNAIPNAEKALSLGIPEKQNEAELYLILANSYGIQKNNDKAMSYADKAVNLARAQKLATLLQNAEAVKKELSGGGASPKKQLTPVEKFQWQYDQKKYSEAIAAYNSLPESDKKNHLNLVAYADSLYQLKRYDDALGKFEEAYGMKKIGQVAALLAEIYELKGKRDSKYTAMAIDYYAEASLLYGKERKSANQQAALSKAKSLIGEKYNYNKRAADLNKKMPKNDPNKTAANNQQKIRQKERELQLHQREVVTKYGDMEPPSFETDKTRKLEKEIAALKSGAAPKPTDPALAAEAEALEKDKKKIDEEYQAALSKARQKLGM